MQSTSNPPPDGLYYQIVEKGKDYVQAQDDADIAQDHAAVIRDEFLGLLDKLRTIPRAAAKNTPLPTGIAQSATAPDIFPPNKDEIRLIFVGERVELRTSHGMMLRDMKTPLANLIRTLAGSPSDPTGSDGFLPFVSRSELLDRLAILESGVCLKPHALAMRIKRLRNLLAERGFGSKLVITKREGNGYRYRLGIPAEFVQWVTLGRG